MVFLVPPTLKPQTFRIDFRRVAYFYPPPLYKTLLFIDREVLVIAMESHRQRRHLETSRTSCRNCFSKVKHTFVVLMYCSIVTVSTQSRVAHRSGVGKAQWQPGDPSRAEMYLFLQNGKIFIVHEENKTDLARFLS